MFTLQLGVSRYVQVTSVKPDNFEPKIITKTNDYLYAEFSSPTFGKGLSPVLPHFLFPGTST